MKHFELGRVLRRGKRVVRRGKAAGAATALLVLFGSPHFARAHHPDKANQPVHQRIDVIGPIGNRLEPGHRRKYNRPGYWAGKIAYKIAPSSQEAMVWHRAVHAGAYEAPKNRYRLEQHFFYPKPYEALTVGPRRSRSQVPEIGSAMPTPAAETSLPETLDTVPLELSDPASPALPEPQADPELELPQIQLDDDVPSASDAGQSSVIDTVVPLSAVPADSEVEMAVGKQDASQVSRASEVPKKPDLDVADRPVFLRRLLSR